MDRRVKYTQKVIKDTFLSLLEKKDISNITVTEICEIADINRATFYRYYLDVYDLLKKIEDEFMDQIKNSQPILNLTDYSVYSFAHEILTIFYNNKKLVNILFNTNNNMYFLNDVLEVAYEKCLEKWKTDDIDISDDEVEYAIVFVFNGALGMLNYWVKNNFDMSIDDLSRSIEKLSIYGARKFIYKK
ncbi:MAG: TetR/AcrR family transcriptional regulator C-terminal domain-containing protein [Bacilli bacterium]|nr:TetR/AcrR family transcriptional regulator C-terminal domain-containing protein [Bacilli bacterium]